MIRKLLHLIATATVLLTFIHQLPRGTQDRLGNWATHASHHIIDLSVNAGREVFESFVVPALHHGREHPEAGEH